MDSQQVYVTLEAYCLRTGDGSPALHTVEEYMRVGPILSAKTLEDAVEYFLSNTDTVADIREVRSFKVDGRELLSTFIHQRVPDPQDFVKKPRGHILVSKHNTNESRDPL